MIPRLAWFACALVLAIAPISTAQDPPPPPEGVTATAKPDGTILVEWKATDPPAASYRVLLMRILSPDEQTELDHKATKVREKALANGGSEEDAQNAYKAYVAAQLNDMKAAEPTDAGMTPDATTMFVVGKPSSAGEYEVSVIGLAIDGSEGPNSEAVRVTVQLPLIDYIDKYIFMLDKTWTAIIEAVICGTVLAFIAMARGGAHFKIRKIAALEAVEEAVGRATEMGRPVLFVPGIQDMNDIMTIAGVTALGKVAKVAAEYDAKLEVPTSRSLVMTACRETVQNSYLAAGRPDAYNENLIYYVTDEQFGYVAYLAGHMSREKPAACFYFGAFFAESLILAETGNAIGAIQIAGTAETAQLPFFVAACDYTLIGEEFYAASAYLSGEPVQLGSLKGQDGGKIIVAASIILGCLLATAASLSGKDSIAGHAVTYLKETILK